MSSTAAPSTSCSGSVCSFSLVSRQMVGRVSVASGWQLLWLAQLLRLQAQWLVPMSEGKNNTVLVDIDMEGCR